MTKASKEKRREYVIRAQREKKEARKARREKAAAKWATTNLGAVLKAALN